MSKKICIVGALDTKGEEFYFIKEAINKKGYETIVIDVGTFGKPKFDADISSEIVAKVEYRELDELRKKDRGEAVTVMAKGIAKVVKNLYEDGKIDGIISMGGTAGTIIGTSAMSVLPIGVPKVMVSTVASGNTSGYVGIKDIVMFPSIVDISGINRISRQIFTNAVGAITGMVAIEKDQTSSEKPLIAATMFGNTTQCVEKAIAILEKKGYEVLVFHATGTGGRTMESLIEDDFIAGVLDVTTTELADELVGGVLSAGPNRLDAAAKKGIPAIIVPGCLDMVNFWAPDTVPEKFKDRKFYQHNPNVTLMRTNIEEMEKLGKILAEKINKSVGPVKLFIPLKGLSMIDSPNGSFWWPEANKKLFNSIKGNIRKDIEVKELNLNINDPEFAEEIAYSLLSILVKK
ncbi:MAG: Tm-1-like ATP-binding domain-containing protein [Candidatus Humimicrobiaceae bacterium]